MHLSLTFFVLAFAAYADAFTHAELVERELGESFSFLKMAKRQGSCIYPPLALI
jgi:hypothetical protein